MRCVIDSPIGSWAIDAHDGRITRIHLTQEALRAPSDALLTEAVRQLTAYFQGRLTAFDLPLNAQGTAFQAKCWAALEAIPFGETISYAEQARRVGNGKAARAVGGANRRNPICIVIPCHRVIGADGALTGYAGSGEDGLRVKQWLIEHERKVIHNS